MTYVYFGHGRELTLEEDKVVLPGRTLSTITEAGIPSNVASTLNICNQYLLNKAKVSNPTDHYRELYTLFSGSSYPYTFLHKRHLQEGVYHLKTEGEKYSDKSCSFLFDFDKGDVRAILRSGLYNLETRGLFLPVLQNRNIRDEASVDINPEVGITIENIRRLYRGCVYPNVDEMISSFKDVREDEPIPYPLFVEAINKFGKKNVSELMEEFPGNHYFFVCRDYGDEYAHSFNTIQERRKGSKEMANARLGMNSQMPSHITPLKSRHNFKLIMKKAFAPYLQTSRYNTIIQAAHASFDSFNSKRGDVEVEHFEFINKVIRYINESLIKNIFIIQDIDDKLLRQIKQTQDFGALCFIGYKSTDTNCVEDI
jgi:hypothetical protein